MSVTGTGPVPVRAGIPVSDLAAGLYLAVGILAALHERERTGTGRWVQTSLLEAMIGRGGQSPPDADPHGLL